MTSRFSQASLQLPFEQLLPGLSDPLGRDRAAGKQHSARAKYTSNLREGVFGAGQMLDDMQKYHHVSRMIRQRQRLIEITVMHLGIAGSFETAGIDAPVETGPSAVDAVANKVFRDALAATHIHDVQGPANSLTLLHKCTESPPVPYGTEWIVFLDCHGVE